MVVFPLQFLPGFPQKKRSNGNILYGNR